VGSISRTSGSGGSRRPALPSELSVSIKLIYAVNIRFQTFGIKSIRQMLTSALRALIKELKGESFSFKFTKLR